MKRSSKLWLLLGLTAAATIVPFFMPSVPQALSYHAFADWRMLWGIPNFANVVSNVPFLFVGAAGMMVVGKAKVSWSVTWMYGVLFAGVFLTGIGSGYYHLHPDNETLVWNRIPMMLVFMSLLAATVAELVYRRAGLVLFGPLLALGAGSVLWWQCTELRDHGDLRLYGLVQFYPILFIPLLLWLFYDPAYRPAIQSLACVVVWYVVAKVAETLDRPIYGAVGL